MDWFLYDKGLRHERVKESFITFLFILVFEQKIHKKNNNRKKSRTNFTCKDIENSKICSNGARHCEK